MEKGIYDFFREQSKSSLLLNKHPEIINSVLIKPKTDQESKMIEIL